MPTILIKKSDTPGAAPTGSDLTNLAGGAEIAVNTADKRVFSMNSSSAIIELGTNPGSLTTADASATVFRSGSATITNLIATTATVSDLSATVSRAGSATITNLLATSLTVSSGSTLDGGVVVNEPGADVDFRVEGDTDANLLFVDASTDRVGVGTNAPSYKFDLDAGTGGNIAARFVARSTGTIFCGTNDAGIFDSDGSNGWSVNEASDFARVYTNGLERLRVDSAGNLGIGTSSPQDLLDVTKTQDAATAANILNSSSSGSASARLRVGYDLSNCYDIFRVGNSANIIQNATQNTANIIWQIAGSEAMRVDSSGNLLVGTTSTTPNPGVAIFPTGGMGQGNSAGGSGFEFNSFRRSAVQIGSITQNGTTAVAYNTSSDRRLKENITAAPEAGAKIDAIEIVSHDWKSAPDEHVEFGVVAQDLYAVAPQAVNVGDDGDEIEKIWGVDYSKLVPMLVKEIQSLRARVAALEAK